ncbi:hypothetical protein D5687_01515 [Guyparkeria sp. SCN-R1]|nr:hypothetical protein D5687_01515 [Guyparkeria sp. SCN-R1]
MTGARRRRSGFSRESRRRGSSPGWFSAMRRSGQPPSWFARTGPASTVS